MRKFLLLTMMCVLGLFAVNAQNLSIVEIGADKNPDYESNYYLPVFDAAKDAMSQQIYTAEEMGDNTGAIMTVGFKLGNSTSAKTRKYEVYLKSTELDEFDVTHYIDLDEADKVFDGDVEISGEMDSWFTITLDKAFNYTGGNIVLAVYDKTGVGLLSDYHYFYKYEASGRALFSKGNVGPYDMLNLGVGLKRSYVNQIQFGMATKATVAVSTDSVALGDVKVGEYWAEESAVKSATFNIQANATLVTSVSCDNAFFTLNYDLTATPITVKVGYDKTAEAGEQTATITIKANNVEDITIPVTATAYTPATADVYELAQEITFDATTFTHTPEFANLNDDYNLPNEVNNGITPDAVYSFELEEELTVVVDVTGKNAVAAIYAEDFAGKGGPKADNNYGGIVPAKTTFFFDFNDGSLEAFNLRDDDNDGRNWGISSGKLMSYSWMSGHGNITPDNYVFTKEAYAITDASKVTYKVNAVNDNTGHYAVVVSEDGENFDIVFEEDYNLTAPADKEVNLSAYAGKMLYIGFRHFNCTGYHIDIDDFQLTDGSGMTRGASAEPQIKVSYPAGKYYLVAAAEDQFTVNVTLDIAPPAAPDTLYATTVNETSIKLEWAAVEEIDGYNIYKGEELLTTVETGVTTYTVEGLECNTNYCFAVSAVNKGIESFKTAPACAKTNDYVIAEPANVAVTAIDQFSVKLTWDAVEYAQSYNIYVGENTISTTETSYVFENLMPATEYCFEVSAVRNVQETEKVKACGKTEAIDFNDENLATEFFYDFNDQSLEDFMLLDNDNDGNNWSVSEDKNNAGEYILKSYSNVIGSPDNYIFTKAPYRIIETSTVTLNAKSGTGVGDLGEHYAVVVSENGIDWTIVFEETIEHAEWTNTSVSLAAYAGKGVLIGIRHYNCSGFYFLGVDNFRLSQVVLPEAPAAPVVTPEATSDSTIVLTWAAVDGATNYNVYSADTLVANVTETTYTVTGLEAEKEYCFNVTAINEVGESVKSENACATTLEKGNDPVVPEPEVPSAPKVKAEATSDSTIVLTWNPVMTATSFNVYSDTVVIATVTETTYTVTGLEAEKEYCFTVTAINENGESAKSEAVCATTKPDAIAENVAAFNIYPNPVSDKLYIETQTQTQTIEIYDMFGRQQSMVNGQQSMVIDVTNLNSGVYFVKVVTANGEAVQRFIKK